MDEPAPEDQCLPSEDLETIKWTKIYKNCVQSKPVRIDTEGATESVLINNVSIIDQVSMKQDLTVGLFYMYVKWQLWKDWEYMEKGKDLIT